MDTLEQGGAYTCAFLSTKKKKKKHLWASKILEPYNRGKPAAKWWSDRKA